MHIGSKYILPLFAVAALGACGDGTGANGRADVRVVLSQSVASPSMNVLAGSGAADQLAVHELDSLNLTITAVEALPPVSSDTVAADSAGEGRGGWVTLGLPAPVTVDLLHLPSSQSEGFQLARGSLPAGTYTRVRLLVSGGSVVFKRPVTVGQAAFAAGQRVPLEVPSGKIKTPISFTVGADSASALGLVFYPSLSVRNVTVTGSGRIKINPVMGRR
jgi:hypothetical protein